MGGDTIRLAAGDYGDFAIKSKAFASDVTITSADAGNPAVFHTLNVAGSSNINFQGLKVDFNPTTSTMSNSAAVTIDSSKGITFSNGIIEGGPAITGVQPTATALDSTGNVIGYSTGRGIYVVGSNDIEIRGTDISQVHRGIVLGSSDSVTIAGNEIHDTRGTGIVGGASNLTIEENYIHSITPWRIGQTGGDHADYIALWTDPRQTSATENVVIRDNVMSRGHGDTILGMWMQGGTPGFENVLIEGNAILGSDNSGIVLSDVHNGKVVDNVLLQTGDSPQAPGIIMAEGTKNIMVSDNYARAVSDKLGGSTGNILTNNTLVSKAGTSADLISKVLATHDADQIGAIVDSTYGNAPISPTEPTSPTEPAPPPVVEVPTGNQNLVGSYINEVITGGDGNDTIDGRGGTDQLAGGKGDDTYYVPNSNTTVVENADEGADTVIARGDYVLGVNLENLTIGVATNGWAGTGNELNNVIVGNAGINRLSGLGGNDTLDGGQGSDILTGGAGADAFRFVVGGGKDVVTDFGVGGSDTIDISSYLKAGYKAALQQVDANTVISFSNGESITLTGIANSKLVATATGYSFGAPSDGGTVEPPPVVVEPPPVVVEPPPVVTPPVVGVTLIGSSGNNVLTGGAGNDTIDGRGGTDQLIGGKGDDTYYVPNSKTTVVERAGEGTDTVIAKGDYVLGANLENLTINTTATNGWSGTGNGLNNFLQGNAGSNQLDGMAGNDTVNAGGGNDLITGGAGNDMLIGGRGVDNFRFGVGSGKDVITDFGFDGADRIDTSAYMKAGYKAVMTQVGEDTVISFGTGDSITLTGVDAHHVSATSTGFVYV